MIASCFDPKSGLYSYYETPDDLPVNADLPVPSLGPDVGGIGVPSINAARPMPSGARLIGQGWHARGIIISCGRTPMGNLDLSASSPWVAVGALAGLAVLIGMALRRS